MCGLLSFNTDAQNGFDQTDFEIMFSMFFLNMLRGTDSTGVMGLTNKDELCVYKSLGNLYNLMKGDKYDEAFRTPMFQRGKLLLGHGRSATKGTVSIANAHPFVVDRETKDDGIVLAHNGTLDTYQGLDGLNNHDVDSMWIAEILSKEGPDVLGKINGAMALIWYDQKEKTINFFRNSQRPLSIAVTNGQYFVASEDSVLHYIKSKHFLKYKHSDVMEFTPMMHCWMKTDELMNLQTIEDFSAKEIKRVVVTKPIYQTPIKATGQGHLMYDDEQTEGFMPIEPRGSSKSNSRFHRSLLNDIARMGVLEDGDAGISRVVWKDGKRYTFFRDTKGTTWELCDDKDCDPYEPGLVSLERPVNNLGVAVTKVYEHKIGRRTYVSMDIPKVTPFEAKVALLEGKGEKDYSGAGLCINQRFKPGKKFSFHTKVGIHSLKLIKHRGRSLSNSTDGGSLEYYTNDADGDFKLNEVVQMEVSQITEVAKTQIADKPVFKVIGWRLKTKMDECVNVQFFVTGKTRAEIETYPFYSGLVTSMRIATKPVHEESGAVVVMTISEPKPIAKHPEDKGNNVVSIH